MIAKLRHWLKKLSILKRRIFNCKSRNKNEKKKKSRKWVQKLRYLMNKKNQNRKHIFFEIEF